ncbi:MAG: biopolymer transporter ExbD, partial [Gammaproteobacteria bacterium]|nr:biopolymer transporter ExbD [Gammaproteobacteria bacterium]
MKLRKPRAVRKGQIQIIPMIDVMFFLLATFMLASLSMQNLDSLQVNLPEGKAEKLSADKPVTLTLTKDREIF